MKLEVVLPTLAGANYQLVYIDPSWLYYGDKFKDQAAGKHYDCMVYDAIAALPVREIMAPRSVLFCWVTSPLAFYQMLTVAQWGLYFRGFTYVWPKTRKDGQLIHGQGVRPTLTKPTTEFLTAWSPNKRGRPIPIFTEKQAQVWPLPRPPRHSEKPAIFRDLLIQLCGDVKRIELWSRDLVEGWDAIGDELPYDKISPFIPEIHVSYLPKPHWLTKEECAALGELKSKPEHEGDPTACFDNLWYFFDESWNRIKGPFKTRKSCRSACKRYAKTL